MPSTSSRRRFLLTAAASSLFVSGCLEEQDGSDSTPTGTPEPSPTDDLGIPTPDPEPLSHDVVRTVGAAIEQPEATALHGTYQLVYLQSTDDIDRLDEESLDDEQRAFFDDTDFSRSRIVAAQITVPSQGAEPVLLDFVRRGKRARISVEIDGGGGPTGQQTYLFLIRITPTKEFPEAANMVIVNDTRGEDDEPIELDTGDDE